MKEILNSLTLASVGSGFLNFEGNKMENFNIHNEFSQTLQGTQLKTVKSVLKRIQNDATYEDRMIQTLDDPIRELGEE